MINKTKLKITALNLRARSDPAIHSMMGMIDGHFNNGGGSSTMPSGIMPYPPAPMSSYPISGSQSSFPQILNGPTTSAPTSAQILPSNVPIAFFPPSYSQLPSNSTKMAQTQQQQQHFQAVQQQVIG